MKWIITGATVLVVAAGGVGAYTLLKDDEPASNQQVASTNQAAEPQPTTEQASIEELLTRNASLECTYEVNAAGSTNTGIAYFSGGKNMYGEFTNTKDGKSSTAYVIRNGDTQYVWTKDSNKGYKANVSAFTKEKQQELSQQFDPDQKYQFACKNWQEDASKFTPPSSVTFTDISAQTKQLQDAINSARQR